MEQDQLVEQKHLERISQLTNAQNYFEGLSELEITPDQPSADQSFTGPDGLFTMVFAGKNLFKDPNIQKKVDDASYYLQGFVSLVTKKLLAGQTTTSFNIPGTDVLEVAKHLPLLADFEAGKAGNHIKTTTAAFSTSFLKIALDMAISDPKILKDTEDFITSLGKEITVAHDVHATNYALTMFSSAITVTGENGVDKVQASFKISSTTLDIKDVKTTVASCFKYESFELDFDADTFTAIFDLDALNNPTIKAQVDSLVTGGLVNQVKKSKNYFGVGN